MSTRIQVDLQPAYVLHRRPYRDNSLLLETFSRDHGRVGLVARGARQGRSRLQGVLQPFRLLLLSWSGRGELATLRGAETDGHPFWLEGMALYSGFYLNELMTRLLPRHDPHPKLFETYHAGLRDIFLGRGTVSLETALRVFEKRLLAEIGYGLVLDREAHNGVSIVPEETYVYDFNRGPKRINGNDYIEDSLTLIKGRSLLALQKEGFDEKDDLKEAKRLLRAALALYLGDRPLHSRRLFVV